MALSKLQMPQSTGLQRKLVFHVGGGTIDASLIEIVNGKSKVNDLNC
jgi:hypothetical protein